MKKITPIILLTAVLFITGCGGKNKRNHETAAETPETVKILPEGAIPAIYDGHIYVNMRFQDTLAGYWLFDTGATMLYPDKTYLNLLGYRPANTMKAYAPGAGDGMEQVELITDTLTLGSKDFLYTSAMSPILDVRSIVGKIPDGIIGIIPFQDKPFMVNYDDGYLLIYERLDSAVTAGFTKVSIEFTRSNIYVPLTIGIGDGTVISDMFLMDTGSGGGISLTRNAAEKYGLDKVVRNKTASRFEAGGIGGEAAYNSFKASNISIGDFTIADQMLDYSSNSKGALGSGEKPYAGLVGNKILDRFVLILDIPGKTLYLKPGNKYGTAGKESLSGMALTDRTDIYDGWVVNGLDAGGAAEKAGLAFNDIVTGFNGKPAGDRTWEEYREASYIPEKEYALTVNRNGEIFEAQIKNGSPRPAE